MACEAGRRFDAACKHKPTIEGTSDGTRVPRRHRALALGENKVALEGQDFVVSLGPPSFEHACRLGLEGIVSKRKGSRYQSGRSRDWVKAKNPEAPAITRLAEEDWARSWSSSSGRRSSSR